MLKGSKHSETTKKRIGRSGMGRICSEETKKKIGIGNKNKIVSDETKEKLRKANKGKIISIETRRKISESQKGRIGGFKGRHHSENTKKKLRYISIKNGNKPPSSLGKHHSLETRMKISVNQIGKKNHNWKGGRVALRELIRKSFEYRQWRSDVFTRDNFICQECFVKGGIFEAHHKKEFSIILDENNIKTLYDAIRCEELWNINNGVTLCKDCHKRHNVLNQYKKSK